MGSLHAAAARWARHHLDLRTAPGRSHLPVPLPRREVDATLHDQRVDRRGWTALPHRHVVVPPRRPLASGHERVPTAAISGALERSAGTVRLVAITLWAVPLAGLISCALSLLLTAPRRRHEFRTGPRPHLRRATSLRAAARALSGVIFALAACEAARGGGRRSVFGVVEVPARLYPWALLVAMQVIIPNVSFVGHLGGLVVGSLEVTGWLAVALPSANAAAAVDGVFAAPGLPVSGRGVQVRTASGAGDILSAAARRRRVVKLLGLGRAASAARQQRRGAPRPNHHRAASRGDVEVWLVVCTCQTRQASMCARVSQPGERRCGSSFCWRKRRSSRRVSRPMAWRFCTSKRWIGCGGADSWTLGMCSRFDCERLTSRMNTIRAASVVR